jgi:hypothetical protein
MDIGLGCASSQKQTSVMKSHHHIGISSAFRGELGQRFHDVHGFA